MFLSDIKSDFHSRLRFLYPPQEINAIFNLAIEFLLSYSKMQIHQNLSRNISGPKETEMLQILERLSKAEPIQYVIGYTEFYGLKFAVDKRVLIPRPETELLVGMLIRDQSVGDKLQILDIGTGSGCIAIVLSKFLPHSLVTAIDTNYPGLQLAQSNAELNSVSVTFICDTILNPTAEYPEFQIMISNPPYVRESEKKYIHRNILEYEPPDALYISDVDPLIYYRAIASFAEKYLTTGGRLYLELNENLGAETAGIFHDSGFNHVILHNDLNNKCRYLTAQK